MQLVLVEIDLESLLNRNPVLDSVLAEVAVIDEEDESLEVCFSELFNFGDGLLHHTIDHIAKGLFNSFHYCRYRLTNKLTHSRISPIGFLLK